MVSGGEGFMGFRAVGLFEPMLASGYYEGFREIWRFSAFVKAHAVLC